MIVYPTTRIQEKGQVTIPQELRKKLHLKQGDLVAFVETKDGVALKPLEAIAEEMLAALEKKIARRGISLDKLMSAAMKKGGDAAAKELGVKDDEKEIFYQALSLRAQAAVRTLQENAAKYGTNKLTEEDIEAEIQAVRKGK
jgi:AbrB family looped-hinge helix DNA binding protein